MTEKREGGAVTRGSGDPGVRRPEPILPRLDSRPEANHSAPDTGWSPTAWRKEDR